MQSEMAIARNGSHPACTSLAIKIPTKAIIDPTERSMPPERITNDSPTAATPTKAMSFSKFTMTRGVPKFG
jgi:hypothetical protein